MGNSTELKSKRTAVLSGATGGIGHYICLHLIRCGYKVIIPCRNPSKGELLKEFICRKLTRKIDNQLLIIEADMEKLSTMEAFCEKVIEITCGKIELLINNAGIIAPCFRLTQDGFERSFQVNYLVPRYMTEKLLPSITEEIINIVSCTVKVAKLDEYSLRIESLPINEAIKYRMDSEEESRLQKNFGHLKNYGSTKLLLWRYSIELSKKCGDKIVVEMADPGVVNTGIITMHRWYDPLADLFFRPFIKSPERGAKAIIDKIMMQSGVCSNYSEEREKELL